MALIQAAFKWLAIIAAVGTFCTDTMAESRVTHTDPLSHYIAFGISQAVQIELPAEATEALVADPSIVTAVIRTQRRAYIIGAGAGQTDVFFVGANGRVIDAWNVSVYPAPTSPLIFSEGGQLEGVVVFRGRPSSQAGAGGGSSEGYRFSYLRCSKSACLNDPRKPGAEEPPNTQNINILSNAGIGAPNVNVGGR